MTNEEAHGYMEDLQRIFTQYCFIFSREIAEANGKAIEALEKQIPEKPIHITRNEHSTRIIGYGCPACHKDVIGSSFYCWSCGQAIDWSDEK